MPDFWWGVIFSLFAVSVFAFSEWGTVKRSFKLACTGLWARLRAIWRWLGTWKWLDTIIGVGWGVMLGSHEYLLALICLGVVTLSSIAIVVYWNPEAERFAKKAASLVAVCAGCVLLTLITLANKGIQEWSQIPSYIASRMPLPPLPECIEKTQVAPKVSTVPKAMLLEAEKAERNS